MSHAMAPVGEALSQLQGFVAKGAAELSQGLDRSWQDAVAHFDAARRRPLPLPLPLASIAGADRDRQVPDGQDGGFRLPDPFRALQAAMSGKAQGGLTVSQDARREPGNTRRRRIAAAPDESSDGLVLVANNGYGDGSATDVRPTQLPTIRTSMSHATVASHAGGKGARAREGVGEGERGLGKRVGGGGGGAVVSGSVQKGRDPREYEELAYSNDDDDDLPVFLPPHPPSPLAAHGSSPPGAPATAAAAAAVVVVNTPGRRRQAEQQGQLRRQQQQQQAGGVGGRGAVRADGTEEWAGPPPDFLTKAAQEAGPATKEELGRATWTFLHTLAAQFPEKPTKQQQKDAKEFVTLLARVYPCKICSYHFQKIVKANPPEVGSRGQLEQYMCRLHNIVNRSLKKPEFPCKRVSARWGSLECEDSACTL